MSRANASPVVVACLSLALLRVGPVHGADVYFEQTVSTHVNQRLHSHSVSRVWHSGQRMRVETGAPGEGTALVLRLDTQEAWALDLEARLAQPIDLPRLRSRSHLDLSMAADLMGVGELGSARTVALEGVRQVAGYPCRGYRVSSGNTVLELCLTEQLPIGIEDFAALLEWSGADVALAAVLTEIRKLSGFPLATRSRITIGEATHETLATVTEVRLERAPAERFSPPSDFQIVGEAGEP